VACGGQGRWRRWTPRCAAKAAVVPGLWRAAVEQARRRGIVAVRELIPLADPLAESPMESEARLAMIDGGLPIPKLQYEIVDGNRERRRVDFAWPNQRVAVEYDGVDWHNEPDAMKRDRRRCARWRGTCTGRRDESVLAIATNWRGQSGSWRLRPRNRVRRYSPRHAGTGAG
jgi:hypothetical protein